MGQTAEKQQEAVPFEQALKELEAIVRKLESGSGDLEVSIQEYVRGTQLKDYCLEKLQNARLQVERIMKSAPVSGDENSLSLQPFDAN